MSPACAPPWADAVVMTACCVAFLLGGVLALLMVSGWRRLQRGP